MRDYASKLKMMKECRRYIDDHLYEDITPENLAAYFHYSYGSFRRIFQEIGGYSVYQYIRLRKIQKAAKYLRHGGDLDSAAKISGYKTHAGFYKAFLEVYGVSPSDFIRTRGQGMMTEPKIMKMPDFYVVGYVMRGEGETDPEECGAYWIAQEFPDVSPQEWARIGGGLEMVGIWADKEEDRFYIIGPRVKKVRYVPEPMESHFVPGGKFAVFPVAPSPDNTLLWENVRVTWFYAYKQWLPDSDYIADESRIPYEFYLDNENKIFVPIRPKIR